MSREACLPRSSPPAFRNLDRGQRSGRRRPHYVRCINLSALSRSAPRPHLGAMAPQRAVYGPIRGPRHRVIRCLSSSSVGRQGHEHWWGWEAGPGRATGRPSPSVLAAAMLPPIPVGPVGNGAAASALTPGTGISGTTGPRRKFVAHSYCPNEGRWTLFERAKARSRGLPRDLAHGSRPQPEGGAR